MDISGSSLIRCRIREADFSGAVLKKVVLRESDLLRAVFDRTDLRDADLRDAGNYIFDPGRNKCKGTRLTGAAALNIFSLYGIKVE